MAKNSYMCVCGKTFGKSIDAGTTGYRLKGYDKGHECFGCPYVEEIRSWSNGKMELCGYECRATLGKVNYCDVININPENTNTASVDTLDMDFIAEFIVAYIQQASSPDDLKDVSEKHFRSAARSAGRRIYSFAFQQNKRGKAAKKVLLDRFSGRNGFNTKDKVLADIAKGKELTKQDGSDTESDVRAQLKAFGAAIDENMSEPELKNVLNGYRRKAEQAAAAAAMAMSQSEVLPVVDTPADKPQQRNIADITAEIRFYKAQTVSNIIEIGKRLLEAKEQLEHGQWGEWLQNEVDFSQDTANNFMKIAKEYSNSEPVRNLSYTSVVALLSLPADEREDFIEAKHEVAGEEKSVQDMSKRELQKAIADYKAAKAAKEALERRLKDKDTILEKANQDLKKTSLWVRDANAKIKQLDTEKASLAQRLKVAESRPVDIAVREPNEAEKEALRQEGYIRAKNELVVSKTTAPVAILEDPLGSFITQIDGAVSTLTCAVGYMPDNSGLSLLTSARDVLYKEIEGITAAYDKLLRYNRAQNPTGLEIDF
ncbi:MAG: DUF3102 domain-containing protein [Candidatus Fimivivens sp.]|nr:DUF3102 domain-containing protein [Candidatus Fimivivens sp.]